MSCPYVEDVRHVLAKHLIPAQFNPSFPRTREFIFSTTS
jgi:hypothetical protein